MSDTENAGAGTGDGPPGSDSQPQTLPPPYPSAPPAGMLAPVAYPESSDPDPVTSDTGDEVEPEAPVNKPTSSDDRSEKSDGRSSGSGEDDKGLHIFIPSRSELPSVSEDGYPKSPAEKVRNILQPENGDDVTADVQELRLDMHALFCQMDILCHFEDGEKGWKESARWLKYEEKVEAGDRWSKPHVPTASLHALKEIKRGLEDNVILLDLDAPHGCIHQVSEKLTDAIMEVKGLSEDKRQPLLDVLVKPHKHKHRKGQKQEKQKPKSPGSTPRKECTLERGSTLDSTALDQNFSKTQDTGETEETPKKKKVPTATLR